MENVRLSDCELRVACGAYELLVVNFYAGRRPYDAVEVITWVYDKADVKNLVEVLSEVIKVLRANDWVSPDELGFSTLPETKDPPF